MSIEINTDYKAFKLLDDPRVYKYLSSIATLPCNFNIKTLADFKAPDGNDMGYYQHCYYESTPIKPEDSNKGVEGFVIGYKDKDSKNNVIYILDIINGELVKISHKGQEISAITGSIVDIGKGSKCGLLSDFMSYILLDQRIDKPEPYQIVELVKLLNTWFDKTTNELCEEVEKIREEKYLKRIEKKMEKNKNGDKIDINTLNIHLYEIPSKKFADLFKPDSIEKSICLTKDDDSFRIWVTNILDENLNYEEESLFLIIGNILYVFNQIEVGVWVQFLDGPENGYGLIPSNNLHTKLFELFNKTIEVFPPYNNFELYKEISLLLVACTNKEIANENLSIPELIAITSELIGYNFNLANPKIKGL